MATESTTNNQVNPSNLKTTIIIKTVSPIFADITDMFVDQFAVESKVDKSIQTTELVYGVGVDMKTLQKILKKLNYLPISQVRSTVMAPNAVELRLGRFEHELHTFSIKTNTPQFLERIQENFGTILADANVSIQPKPNNSIQYGGADETFVRLLALKLKKLTGDEVSLNKAWGDDDGDIWIHIVDPETKGKPIRAWLPLAISCDDPVFAQDVVDCLKSAGFDKVRLAEEDEKQAPHPGFFFEPAGFLSESRHSRRSRSNTSKGKGRKVRNAISIPTVVRDVETVVSGLLKRANINANEFPVEIGTEVTNAAAVLHIPISKCRSGAIMPYGGNFPGAFPVTIRTDDLLLAEGLSVELREKGFLVKTAYVDSSELLNPCMDWGEFASHSLASDLKTTIANYLVSQSLPILLPPIIRKADSKEINIDLPSAKNFPLSQRNYAEVAKDFTVSVNVDRTNPHFALIEQKLMALGVRRVKTRRGRGPGENIIHFGGAPSALMAEIVGVVQPYLDSEFEMAQYWGDEDRDIYIFLPDIKEEPIDTEPTFDIQKWLGATRVQVNRPFISTTSNVVVGNITMDCPNRFDHPRTPVLNDFKHYCIDSKTASLLERVSEAVAGNECLLLEGSTATSKTSSILYLAALVGQPVMRLNLSGATDVSEFVGRFVPDESREGNGWKWEDGPVVKAMLEGYWLILDELNLAEASVLERLNSILERNPSLLLSEYNDRLIGGEAFPVHSAFRVFGTQNPEHYAGRNALSPAYRDRFHETHVSNPNLDAKAMEEMLNWLVFGQTPNIMVNGVEYSGFGTYEPTALAEIPSMGRFLKSVSIFHASLCAASSSEKGGVPKIGADRMGGYSFTRRGLLRLTEFLQRHLDPDLPKSEIDRVYRLALVRTYLDRVDVREHTPVINLLNAAGIGPETWVL